MNRQLINDVLDELTSVELTALDLMKRADGIDQAYSKLMRTGPNPELGEVTRMRQALNRLAVLRSRLLAINADNS